MTDFTPADLDELQRLYDARKRYEDGDVASPASVRALGRLSSALVGAWPRLLVMIKEQAEAIELWKERQSEAAQESQRNRAKYEAAEAECVRLQARAELAEAEVMRLRAGRCQHGIPVGDLCDEAADRAAEQIRTALAEEDGGGDEPEHRLPTYVWSLVSAEADRIAAGGDQT